MRDVLVRALRIGLCNAGDLTVTHKDSGLYKGPFTFDMPNDLQTLNPLLWFVKKGRFRSVEWYSQNTKRSQGSTVPSPLGDKIRARRKEKGLSLEGLAALTDSSKSYIWELENRDVPNPSAEKIARLAAALEVTPQFLLDATLTTPDQAVADEAFFRKYQGMPEPTKKQLRRILDSWDDDD